MRPAIIPVALMISFPAWAQNPPGKVVEGAPSVTINGNPAARQDDQTSSGAKIAGGSGNVTINGRPAATIGTKTECGGMIVSGSPSVFINGRPAATASSQTTPCLGAAR